MKSALSLGKILVAVKPASPDGGALQAGEGLAAAAGAGLVTLDPTTGGVPAVEIVRAADREAADLIIVAREPLEVVEGTVRRARVPCFVVPGEATTFHRILVAVDAGPDTAEILDAAATIAELLGSEVEAIHIERGAPLPIATRSWPVRPGRAAVETKQEMLVRQGEPATEILRAVREEEIDVLVFGHHRGGPRNGHETGSIAARLLARAPCAVLTVPI